MRKDRIDAFVLGTKRWTEASGEWAAASTSLATALRDLAEEIEADPVLRVAMSYTPEAIRRYAEGVDAKATENRDMLLKMSDLKKLIDGLEDYRDEAG
jgi:hypothetical protein